MEFLMLIERRLVCSFLLPSSLRPRNLVDWVQQMVTLHSGVRVTVETESEPDSRSIRVFAHNDADAEVIRCAIATNRQDWQNAGLKESAA